MSKKTHTKRALLSSVIALILCCAMLLGTTFAWFTDTATSGTNTISSGNLDVVLENANGNVASNTMLFDDVNLWEPGAMAWEKLTVKNNGTLALKYNLSINITSTADEAGKSLADVLKVVVLDTVPTRESIATGVKKDLASFTLQNDKPLTAGQSDTAYVALYWAPSDNDNAYNTATGYSATIGVNLMATQHTTESDSFDNQYDKDAMYANAEGVYEQDGKKVVYSTAGLVAAANSAEPVESVIYVKDDGEKVEVPVVADTQDMKDAVAAKDEIVVLKTGTYSVPSGMSAGQEITIIGDEDTTIKMDGLQYPGGKTVNFTGVTIDASGYTNGMGNGVNATYTDCTFNSADMYLYGSSKFINCTFNDTGTYALWTWGAGTAEFIDCTFNTTGKAIYVNANVLDNGTNHQTVKITNCKFYDTGDNDTKKAAIETGDDYGGKSYDIFINNSTFEGFAVTEDKTSTKNYGGNNLGTTVWGNKYQMGTDKLNVVIDGVDVY